MAWSDNTKRAVVGGFIVFIMIFSVFGFVMNYAFTEAQDYEYGELVFQQVQNGFRTEIEGTEHVFYLLPTDVEYLEIPDEAKKILERKNFIATYDPQSYQAQAMAEAQYIMEQQLFPGVVVERALTNNTGTQLPMITCENATAEKPVIEFRESDETLIEAKENCIVLNTVDQSDVLRQEELIRYYLLGVLR